MALTVMNMSVTTGVLSSIRISAIANDACPGLICEKQQESDSPHQPPQGSSAEPWFCRLLRQH
jgi:hypothetical protein